jgi:choline monooxygenase
MATNIDELISPAVQDAIRQPIEKAWTLPRQAFTSREVYELEVERIYRRQWVAAVNTYDVGEPGNVKKFEICGMPSCICPQCKR